MKTVFVTGSAGFIGGHLVHHLQGLGYYVIGADIQDEKYFRSDKFYKMDLRLIRLVEIIFQQNDIDQIYNLACLMGGMGYIGDEKHSYDIMVGSTQIVVNIIDCSYKYDVKKHFYSSSACMYNQSLQENTSDCSLKETMAYPAYPDLTYGWQKLFGEQLYQSTIPNGFDIRIGRFHNVFGEYGTWDGGKEKAPAALCRKVAQAKDGDTITIWGDGLQTRSFLYIDECITGIMKMMDSKVMQPLNIGSDELISIEDLAKMVIEISGKKLTIQHDLTKPQGVRGRNSDNTLIKQVLNWSPSQPLKVGIEKLYHWINQQVNG